MTILSTNLFQASESSQESPLPPPVKKRKLQDLTKDKIQDLTQDKIQDLTQDKIQDLTQDKIQDLTQDQIQESPLPPPAKKSKTEWPEFHNNGVSYTTEFESNTWKCPLCSWVTGRIKQHLAAKHKDVI